jgi:hypothetical protein
VSAGFGAALVSRSGPRVAAGLVEQPDISWQTPTPVTGVAAAKRPIGRRGSA